MKIFNASEVREIDRYTIEKEPIKSIDLMERAAKRLTGWYIRHYDIDREVVIFAGPGNNGGDALAMARMLAERQYRVTCYMPRFGKPSEDCRINRERLEKQGLVEIVDIQDAESLPHISPDQVVVEGIFGSGLTRPVKGFPGTVIRRINEESALTISIDVPSGLYGEDNRENDDDHIIRAHYTLTFQFPFLSFFFKENERFTGTWRVLDIQLHREKIEQTTTRYYTLDRELIRGLLPVRKKFSHKGTYGHALLICGSYGMMGAAMLAGEAGLRSGAGLVTLHIPVTGYQIIQTGFPEGIVSLDPSEILFSHHPDLDSYTSVGVGPGIGKKENTRQALHRLLKAVKVPLVIDADGLNILSEHKEWFDLLPENTILTPHPKEFDRLAGPSETAYERHLKQLEFSKRYRVFVVLKGAYTGIATPGGEYWFNTTGNPGMATGGSGDVLTGIITGLLAQGYSPLDACRCGVYIHGLAGDIAARKTGFDALIAGDITASLGEAFRELKQKSLVPPGGFILQ